MQRSGRQRFCNSVGLVLALLLGISLEVMSQERTTLWAQHSSATQLGTTLHTDAVRGETASQILTFAARLMDEGEYFRAVTEYRRFLFFYPDDPRTPMIYFRIGLALYYGKDYDAALQAFSDLVQRYPSTSYGQQAWLWYGETLARQGNYTAAEQLYADLYRRFSANALGQQALYRQAWMRLYRRQWQEASTAFQQVERDSPLHTNAQFLAEEALKGRQLAMQSPLVAGLFSSLLPGGGQLYNGRVGDALLAFLLNGLFIAGIIEATQQKAHLVAGILSFFELGWYTGNIYGAVNGAHKINRYRTENFLRNLENQTPLSLPGSSLHSIFGIRLSLGF